MEFKDLEKLTYYYKKTKDYTEKVFIVLLDFYEYKNDKNELMLGDVTYMFITKTGYVSENTVKQNINEFLKEYKKYEKEEECE